VVLRRIKGMHYYALLVAGKIEKFFGTEKQKNDRFGENTTIAFTAESESEFSQKLAKDATGKPFTY
jgi:hypothetical protein